MKQTTRAATCRGVWRSATALACCLASVCHVEAEEESAAVSPTVEQAGEQLYTESVSRWLRGDRRAALASARRLAARVPDDARALRLFRSLSPDGVLPRVPSEPMDLPRARELRAGACAAWLRGDRRSAQSLLRRAHELDPAVEPVSLSTSDENLRSTRRTSLYDRLFADSDRSTPVSGEFRDVPLRRAMRLFEPFLTRGLSLPGDLDRAVNCSFRDLRPGAALRTVLASARLSLTEEDGALRVTPSVDAEQDMRTFRLQHIVLSSATASDSEEGASSSSEGDDKHPSVEAIRSVLSENGSLKVEPTRRLLVVRDYPDRLEDVERLIARLDRMPLQVRIHARVVEVGHSDLLSLGINWDLDYNLLMTSASQPVTFPMLNNGHDVLRGFRPPRDPADSDFGGPADGTENLFPLSTADDFAFGTLSGGDLGVRVNLSQVLGRSEILSSPRVVTIDGSVARIQIGERIPIPTTTIDSETGNVTVSGFDEERVGILLEVLPYVLDNDRILLRIHPEVSSVDRFVGDVTNQRPIITTREVSTQVIVEDGATLVVGGLIRDSEVESIDQVPVLGDLPLLGRLFRDRSTDTVKTELVMFLTVEIVDVSRSMSQREEELFDARQPGGRDRFNR